MIRSYLPLALLLLLIFNVISCKKNNGSTKTDLAGVWHASAFRYYDSDGKKAWEPEHISRPPILTFDSAGRGTLDARFDSRFYYQAKGNGKLDYFDTLGNAQHLIYTVSEENLTIEGDCSPVCGEKYRR